MALKGALISSGKLFRRFAHDESGNYLIIAALAMPVLVGMAAFGAEEGLMLHNQKSMQHAADSAAATAAVAVVMGSNDKGALQARSVAASYGYVNGIGQTQVLVNSPPTSGPNKNNTSAIEVKVIQPQAQLFSSLWGPTLHSTVARAVATPIGLPCILALNRTASGAYSEQGSVNTTLINCAVIDDSNSSSALNIGGSAKLSTSFAGVVGGISGASGITATLGTQTGYRYVPDPYATRAYAAYSGCDKNNYSTNGNATINPGVYCGGINLGSHASVTLNPGIYYLDRGSLSMTGQTSLTGHGVTLVFTSSTGSNYATASITGGATFNLTAPTTGATAGIAIFGDRNIPVGTVYKFAGGDSQTVGGAVYISRGALQWAGNSDANEKCTQVVADTVTMVGNSALKVECLGYGLSTISTPALLVE